MYLAAGTFLILYYTYDIHVFHRTRSKFYHTDVSVVCSELYAVTELPAV